MKSYSLNVSRHIRSLVPCTVASDVGQQVAGYASDTARIPQTADGTIQGRRAAAVGLQARISEPCAESKNRSQLGDWSPVDVFPADPVTCSIAVKTNDGIFLRAIQVVNGTLEARPRIDRSVKRERVVNCGGPALFLEDSQDHIRVLCAPLEAFHKDVAVPELPRATVPPRLGAFGDGSR
jgi:hypothetical protein